MTRTRRSRTRIAFTVATVAFAAVWAVTLRPQILGGPAAYVIVAGTSMEPRLHTGDLVVLVKERSYEVGDVIAYEVPKGETGEGAFVIHRIVSGSASSGYVTQGDNRRGRDLWRPGPGETLGKMRLAVPRVGSALAFVRTTFGLAFIGGLAAFLFISAGSKKSSRRPRDAAADPYTLPYRFKPSRSARLLHFNQSILGLRGRRFPQPHASHATRESRLGAGHGVSPMS